MLPDTGSARRSGEELIHHGVPQGIVQARRTGGFMMEAVDRDAFDAKFEHQIAV
jgi:hypothetical protein